VNRSVSFADDGSWSMSDASQLESDRKQSLM